MTKLGEMNDYGIARWRNDSRFERMLASLADKGEFWKRLYVWYYHRSNPAYYEKGMELIDRTLESFGRGGGDGDDDLIVDMVYSLHRFGCGFDEYFLFGYPSLNTEGRESFVTDKSRWALYAKLNGKTNLGIFSDKYETFKLYRKFFGRQVVLVRDESDWDGFSRFAENHCRFLVKPVGGCVGRGIRLESSPFTEGQRRVLFDSMVDEGPMVCEELIEQSESMAALHPQSVNTVRMPTIRCKNGVEVVAPFVRMGCGGSVVDNAGAGGIFASVDESSGIVASLGIDEFGNSFVKHPDTQMIIPGFRIPRWDEAVALVAELAEVFLEVRYIGWDLALTDDGWVVVEGNDNGQMIGQMPNRVGVRQRMERLISDI